MVSSAWGSSLAWVMLGASVSGTQLPTSDSQIYLPLLVLLPLPLTTLGSWSYSYAYLQNHLKKSCCNHGFMPSMFGNQRPEGLRVHRTRVLALKWSAQITMLLLGLSVTFKLFVGASMGQGPAIYRSESLWLQTLAAEPLNSPIPRDGMMFHKNLYTPGTFQSPTGSP